jgi:small subunit ribosomal protein S1
VVSGRVVVLSPESESESESESEATIELGEGIRALCRMAGNAAAAAAANPGGAADLSALTSMLKARWKGGGAPAGSQPEPLSVGQIRSFRIAKLDRETEKIELKLA